MDWVSVIAAAAGALLGAGTTWGAMRHRLASLERGQEKLRQDIRDQTRRIDGLYNGRNHHQD